jgi:hypothetical protein
MRTDSGGYRRDHLRAFAQRVEVDQKELRIMGSKSVLLRTLVAASSAKTAGFGVPSSVPKWRAASVIRCTAGNWGETKWPKLPTATTRPPTRSTKKGIRDTRHIGPKNFAGRRRLRQKPRQDPGPDLTGLGKEPGLPAHQAEFANVP